MDNMLNNKEYVCETTLNRLKKIAAESISKGKYEKACAAISSGCEILYEWNQKYTDDEFEKDSLNIANTIRNKYIKKLKNYKKNYNTVLFYDGFGFDTRGWARNYLIGLRNNGYRIIYITKKNGAKSDNSQPQITKILNACDAKVVLFDEKRSYLDWIKAILNAFIEYQPRNAFFYSLPNDVAGCIAFEVLKGYCRRFQIDLTDHAFWIGTKAVDYCIEVREVGVGNAVYSRGFSYDQLRFLDTYVLTESNVQFKGFPFDAKDKKILFSGGSLYKTLGDPNNTFYWIVEKLISEHKNLIFYYLGNGNTSELKKLKVKYQDQVYYEQERDDYYQVIGRCTLYLNTYPFSGGIMVRCAAKQHKIPLTLKNGNENDGFLINQQERKIEYDTADQLVADANRLLSDSEYLKSREKKLDGSVVSEEDFTKNLKFILNDQSRGNRIIPLTKIDTKKFQNSYKNRFGISNIAKSICHPNTISLFSDMPLLFAMGFFDKVFEKLRG